MVWSTHIQVKGGNEMPENNNRDVQDFSKYDAMTTEELAQILRLDSEAPEGNGLDIDTLLYITGVLAERNQNTGKTAQEAWISFQQNYLDSEDEPFASGRESKTKKARKPWSPRAIAAAAALALIVVIPLSANAWSFKKLISGMATWFEESFFFADKDQEVEEPTPDSEKEYTSLQQALEATDQQFNMVPIWFPDGYLFDDFTLDETPTQRNYVSVYKNGDKHLTVSVRSYEKIDPEKIEINEDLIEIYNVSGIEYYIFSNNKRISAIWLQDNYECCISGEITVEELKQMIDSIPKG